MNKLFKKLQTLQNVYQVLWKAINTPDVGMSVYPDGTSCIIVQHFESKESCIPTQSTVLEFKKPEDLERWID